jgi:hypothetical protein
LSTGYLRTLLLADPALANAFGGSLQALSALATAYEDIKAGGVLNLATGGLDLYLLAAKYLGVASVGAPAAVVSFDTFVQAYGLQAIAALQGTINGYEQGGVEGGVEAGYSATELVFALEHLFGTFWETSGAGLDSPLVLTPLGLELAIGIGVVVGLATLIFGGNHDDPAKMPDKYDTARYTQYVGELTGHASTAYGPAYDPATDPLQVALGGLSELSYIQDWIAGNLNSSNSEVQAEAQTLLPLYGTTGNGQLSFDTDLADEAVIGGTESGTYVSIHNDADQAVSEIELLDAEFSAAVVPQGLPAPSVDYGDLPWVPFTTAQGSIGYWAAKGDGTYYYFGPDGELYDDAYEGEVQPQDVSMNLVGNVATYDFVANDPDAAPLPSGSVGYGGVYYG